MWFSGFKVTGWKNARHSGPCGNERGQTRRHHGRQRSKAVALMAASSSPRSAEARAREEKVRGGRAGRQRLEFIKDGQRRAWSVLKWHFNQEMEKRVWVLKFPSTGWIGLSIKSAGRRYKWCVCGGSLSSGLVSEIKCLSYAGWGGCRLIGPWVSHIQGAPLKHSYTASSLFSSRSLLWTPTDNYAVKRNLSFTFSSRLFCTKWMNLVVKMNGK